MNRTDRLVAMVLLAQAPCARAQATAQPRFPIYEFVVEGDTLLGSAAIERAVYEFLGPDRSAAEAISIVTRHGCEPWTERYWSLIMLSGWSR